MANTKKTTTKSNTKNSAKKTTAKSTSNKKTTTSRKNNVAELDFQNQSKSSRGRKKQEQVVEDSYVERDPFFDKFKVDAILAITLALCLIVFIANLGFGGVIGNAVASFFFGVFGLVQYAMPIILFFAVMFMISNAGNSVAYIKSVMAFVFIIFTSALIELISHGTETFTPIVAYHNGFEEHNGGGLFGRLIGGFLVDSFDITISYIVILLIMIVAFCVIFDTFVFDFFREKSVEIDEISKERRQRKRINELERREQRSQQAFERDSQIRELSRRKAERQKRQLENPVEGKRTERRLSGVTTDTQLVENYSVGNSHVNDNVTEIKYNFGDITDVDVVTNRTKVSAGTVSSTTIELKEQETNNIEPVFNMGPVVPEEKPPVIVESKKIVSAPVIEPEPIPEPETKVEPVPEKTRTTRVKASASSKEEIDDSAAEIEKSVSASSKKSSTYKFPPISLLNEPKGGAGDSKDYLQQKGDHLIRTLRNFGVEANIIAVTRGPSVTRYEIQVAEGTKVSKVVGLADDIKMNMAVTDLRIEAPIPGKSAIGIEVPNNEKTMVSFTELVKSPTFKNEKSNIAFCVGKDISGDIIIGNIEKMPHVLIAGATGSGKSVCISSIVMSILYHADPNDVKLIMVDPKVVELKVYNGIPHLLIPVVTEPKKAAGALHWAVNEMTRRYELLAKYNVRNLQGYNEKIKDGMISYIDENGDSQTEEAEHLPQIVIILDELADLMMVAAADVEESICRIAQLARAAGIHLVIATQRPTANVLTGLIKANVPSRIAFSVASALDSRVILDQGGAEDLLGHGDMLYKPYGANSPTRIQGCFVTDEEIEKVVKWIIDNNATSEEQREKSKKIQESVEASATPDQTVAINPAADIDLGVDPLFAEAGRLVIDSQKGSIGYIQRNFRVGFNRAARIMDQLHDNGVVGPEIGTKPREILMTMGQFEELLENM